LPWKRGMSLQAEALCANFELANFIDKSQERHYR
jgi:hypothetical protein